MTTEQRLERLEETDRKLTELTADVIRMIQHQQEQLDQHQERIDHQQEQLEEIRTDAKMTRRLWMRLAAKYGWLDDEDVNGDGA
ncbi:MAG: hypothetical protein OXI33_16720 [Chloroflexota bacterium]|nr:hypothetical protein [Chloroflexota bacterium]